jgi:hypothetical protein
MCTRPRVMRWHGLWVQFAIRDVFFPTPDVVLRELHEEDLIGGHVLDVSGSAETEDVFVVVKVDGMERPVVVPIAKLRDRHDV